MTKIRIESNPYEQEIRYSRYDDTSEGYVQIDEDSHSSMLLGDDTIKCFFPFKAKDILNEIIKDYGCNIEIVFEGSNDEFNELITVKKTDESKFANVKISKGEKYLENGCDVIKLINNIFKQIEYVIIGCVGHEDEDLNQNLKKYINASNDQIPICVIGNTNMGKSTFINALLGAEYLPQDKNRCTAKIYKITESKSVNIAKVKFDCDGEHSILFGDKIHINGSFSDDLKNGIDEIITEVSNRSLTEKVNSLLKFLNSYNEKNNVAVIPDLIELEVPFNSNVLHESDNPFVIFDTPGSNYAGNTADAELLKQQMKNLTNGLPIYVTNYDGLSTNDNDALIDELQSIEKLDQRFTILVINKADVQGLQLNEKKWTEDVKTSIKCAVVPNKLAEKGLQGIYFVSSWFGLGYKNHGSFLDDYDSEEYEDNVQRFNETASRTKRLYKFNILPDQLKKKFEQEITEDIDPVYLNSGLFSIEKEIVSYANTYSAYNKCRQSYIFLNDIFSRTSEIIDKKKSQIEEYRVQLCSNLDEKKKKLIEDLHKEVEEKKISYNKKRDIQIKEDLEKDIKYFDANEFKEIESRIYALRQADNSIPTLEYDYIEFKRDIFSKNILETISTFWKTLVEIHTKRVKLIGANEIAEKESYNDSFKIFEKKYNEIAVNEQDRIYDDSKRFWEMYSEELRKSLASIVTMSEALTEDEKNRLCGKIEKYNKINMEKQDIGDPENRKYSCFWNFRINVDSVVSTFNQLMKDSIKKLCEVTQISHSQIFDKWADNLLRVITDDDKIIDNNPLLNQIQEKIDNCDKEKKQLEANRETIEQCKEEILKMISWKYKIGGEIL